MLTPEIVKNSNFERYDKDCYRILNANEVIGFVLAFSNGTWGIFDADDKRIGKRHFEKPRKAYEHWKEIHAAQT